MANLHVRESEGWLELENFTSELAEQIWPYVGRHRWDVVRAMLIDDGFQFEEEKLYGCILLCEPTQGSDHYRCWVKTEEDAEGETEDEDEAEPEDGADEEEDQDDAPEDPPGEGDAPPLP
jgi:hypothetical protein